MSRAQKQSLFGTPPKASLLAAPTPAPKKRKKGAVRFQPEDSELLALKKQVKELEGKLADAETAAPDAVDDAMSDGREKPSGGRLCFVWSAIGLAACFAGIWLRCSASAELLPKPLLLVAKKPINRPRMRISWRMRSCATPWRMSSRGRCHSLLAKDKLR